MAYFIGEVVTRWDHNPPNGRNILIRFLLWLWGEPSHSTMTLLEDFTFVDDAGYSWKVPAGTRVDGASIPRFFWLFAGPPFRGRYRRASVPHDYYCQLRGWSGKSRFEVHRMFREAMRADGERFVKRWVMWFAVWIFGPWWIANSRSANG